MNLILIEEAEITGGGRVRLTDRRAAHIRTVLRSHEGDILRLGVIGGWQGRGVVVSLGSSVVELDLELTDPPPPPSKVVLLLALPRPKCLRRVLQCVAAMGVKRLALFGAYRVEKSYWDTPWLRVDEMREQFILGLEQGGDTVLPEATIHPLFKPFIEDVVPSLTAGMRRLVAHPGKTATCHSNVTEPLALAVGPEGGFTEYELRRLGEAGFDSVSLGARALRTEHAVAAFLGRLAHCVDPSSTINQSGLDPLNCALQPLQPTPAKKGLA